ncbi:tetraacyldisaccharide 4'-kinase [Leptospira jelokensis]|uniref:tetraacyldisaccharide 4'-kinase n=1 Tax=Leptospira jelokensis TaxID=2484931 RepID=UPI001090B0B7|nr:tetraacyldisaccharide 4'-kinase [Leptospira jelokensis]TGM01233.1 tetraacyldisaccharide 4'-kinase [Leptospira jelokensis]
MKVILLLFYPLTWVYRFLFWLNQIKITPSRIPQVIVISVGNITVGGTGKTPFVQYLVRYFQEHNKDYAITILSRGYKAKKTIEGAILPDGKSPDLYGDEPSQHKERFPNVQVIIGKNRWESFLTHNRIQSPKHIVILDDGFQHKQIVRDLDIVLLDANSPFGNGFTLPLGFLREPINELRRASAVVFTKLVESNKEKFQTAKKLLFKNGIQVPIFSSTLETDLVEINLAPNTNFSEIVPKAGPKVRDGNPSFLKMPPNASYFLFTGVGNPKQVLETAKDILGNTEIKYRFFPDHDPFTKQTLFSLLSDCNENTVLLTTEKDWVKVRIQTQFLKELNERKIKLFLINIDVVVAESVEFESMLAGLVSTYEAKNGLVSKTG